MKSKGTPAPVQNRPQQLPPELIKDLVANQTLDLELRAQELDLQRQQDNHSFAFSQNALKAQLEDRNEQRKYEKSLLKIRVFLVVALFLIIASVILFCLWKDKDTVAMEIIKALVYICSGGLGGYGIRAMESRKTKTEKDS
jgi:hypothetical protein